ncbi:MAG: hypothetical protein C5B53_10335 [Candidatus Melainabacteria bacterium]|nr:MAG: hypothetical protein C5B53_10335 [Candidatus Melainabacteria bacterium]
MSGEKVILIPIDNRPVTYVFPQMVAAAAGVEPIVPARNLMGSLKAPTDLNLLSQWLNDALMKVKPKAIFVCLDSLLYGGLIPSRRSHDSLAEVIERTRAIASWKSLGDSKVQVYAQASIMRIPNYNDATEEPDYWDEHGQKLFQWSTLKHKNRLDNGRFDKELAEIEKAIPEQVRNDFFNRRQRNFQVNQQLVEMAKTGLIDYLVFSQDDTGEYGLNVLEKSELAARAGSFLGKTIAAYAGADEVLEALISRWLVKSESNRLPVLLHFSPERGKNIASNFEGQTIEKTMRTQCQAAGLTVVHDSSTDQAELAIIVHTGGEVQGDHVWLPGSTDLRSLDTEKIVGNTIKLLEQSKVPAILCDVAYSNGADPLLIKAVMSNRKLLDKVWAYAGWNTTGNTVGSALALGIARWFAHRRGYSSDKCFARAQFVRYADDWAYQTQVRPQLAGRAVQKQLQELMEPLLQQLKQNMGFDPGEISLRFPWERVFEVEIALEEIPVAKV